MTNYCESVNNVWLMMIPITLKHTLEDHAYFIYSSNLRLFKTYPC